uniref:Tnp_DDE_dom domain-containing protein n=1 Tax=Steinernema glaseri TaxID=37863 RepID=A0A1I7YLK8_9BILA
MFRDQYDTFPTPTEGRKRAFGYTVKRHRAAVRTIPQSSNLKKHLQDLEVSLRKADFDGWVIRCPVMKCPRARVGIKKLITKQWKQWSRNPINSVLFLSFVH